MGLASREQEDAGPPADVALLQVEQPDVGIVDRLGEEDRAAVGRHAVLVGFDHRRRFRGEQLPVLERFDVEQVHLSLPPEEQEGSVSNPERPEAEIDEPSQMLLFDAQTSGGLLLSVPSSKAESIQRRAEEIDNPLWVVGEVLEGSGIEVTV